MRRFVVFVAVLAAVSTTVYVQAQPVPVWQSTLNDLASITIDGGDIVNAPATFVPGFDGNAFAGNGSVYAAWDNAEVAVIFDGIWNNSLGSTIDLYFSGDHWDTHSGDSGLFAIVDRYSGSDGFYMVTVQNGKLRFPYRDSYTGWAPATQPILSAVPLANNVTYHVTVRQQGTNFEVYLDDVGGTTYSNTAPVYTTTFSNPGGASIAFPQFNTLTGSGGRTMAVGTRPYFGGTLQTGEWVDNVRVFNGYYTPAEIPLPEPGLPVAVATADVFSGFAPLTVQFDGSASYDTNGGTITAYQWDFDNDGTVDDSSGPIVSHQYMTAGEHVCKLTVIDNDNNTASDLVAILVHTLPATGLLTITAMEPSGALPAGSYPLTSVTTQRIGSVQSFTAVNLVGPPDVAHIEVIGDMTGSGAGATSPAEAMVGLELGSTVGGLNVDGEFLAGYFADHVVIRQDGTDAPEIFVIESSNTSDNFQIQLLTNEPGATVEIAATVQVRSIDYASTSTVISGTGRGGVGLDLDALGVASIRGVRLTGADGFGGGSGVDPVLIGAVFEPCNTPFADADGDGDVDQVDFAVIQACFTGNAPGPGVFDPVNCFCVDRDDDDDVDELDYGAFEDCATGPGIPWSEASAGACNP